jgi:hypothetical protein
VYAHELVVDRHVTVQESAAAIVGVGSVDGDDLAVDRCAVETLPEDFAAYPADAAIVWSMLFGLSAALRASMGDVFGILCRATLRSGRSSNFSTPDRRDDGAHWVSSALSSLSYPKPTLGQCFSEAK